MSEKKHKVPKLRFPGFTGDWELRKLGDVIDRFEYGLNAAATEYDGVHKYIRITDIDDVSHMFLKSNLTTPKIDFQDADTEMYKLKEGDILFARTGASVGKTYLYDINDGDLYFAGFLIRGHVNPSNNAKFVYQNTLTENYDLFIKITSQRSGQPGVNSKEYAEFKLYIPSKEEQEKISLVLTDFDNLIILHQRKLESLKLKKKALLQKLFPKNGEQFPELRFPGFTDAWEQRKLGDLAKVEMDKRIYKEQTSAEGEIPFYKIGTFGGKADSYISEDLYNEYTRKYPHPKEGDILISASGSIGRTVVYHGEKAYFQDSNIVWLNHNGALNNEFLLQFYSRVIWAGLEGSTIKRLYNKNILETEINVPDIREQKNIGEFFTQVDNLITLHQRKLEHLQLQKKALLQQMFV